MASIPQKTRHAVLLSPSSLLTENGVCADCSVSTLLDLCELARTQSLTHLWVMSDCGVEVHQGSSALPPQWGILLNWKYPADVEQVLRDNILVSLHGYKELPEHKRSHRLNVIFTEHTTWGWEKHLKGEQLLALVQELEAKLGVPVGGSPAGVGRRYLENITAKHADWLAKSSYDLQSLPFNSAAKPLIWQRLPSQEEIGRSYLIAYDKNAAYPRASVEEDFGIGNPVHVTVRDENDRRPGIWQLEQVTPPSAYPGLQLDLLPSPIWQGASWYAAPIVRLLEKMKYTFTVKEGWIFPEYAPVFERWCKDLWKIRQGYPDHTVGRSAVKMVMNNTLGLTRSTKVADSAKFRPDWNAQIVGGARAVMLYNIIKYALQGYYPILCQLDAVYYLSNECNPEMAVPHILDQSSSLGGYKHKWTLPVTDEVRAIMASTMGQPKKLELLNKLVARQEEVSHVI